MRVRTAISRLFGVAVVGFLIYAVVVAGASYFETRQLVDQAVFEAGRRPRAVAATGQASLATLEEFAVDSAEVQADDQSAIGMLRLPRRKAEDIAIERQRVPDARDGDADVGDRRCHQGKLTS